VNDATPREPYTRPADPEKVSSAKDAAVGVGGQGIDGPFFYSSVA
jgi:hypothetical protein